MSSFEIISFMKRTKGNEWIKEYLVEHVMNMLELYSIDSKSNRYGEYLLEKIFGSSIEFRYYDLMVYSIIMHDIGKAFYPLKIMEGSDHVSFSGHEVFSSIIAYESINRYLEDKTETPINIRYPVFYSIAFHHHAMSVEDRLRYGVSRAIKYVSGRREDVLEKIINDYRYFRGKVNNNIHKLLDYLEEAVDQTLNYSSGGLIRKFKDIKGDVFKIFASNKFYLKKLLHLSLASLICLDYEASRNSRGGGVTFFGEACIDWKEYYLCR
ncbi:MAG: hypothetical protein B6U89_03640 [Desulfurococcales archaeon ex4484_58]|nr:MAG: hypothetical protein B6U89_03640 [Desulfurococcales archaeon ex4484_58]